MERSQTENTSQDIVGLYILDRPALIKLWQHHYRRAPPNGASRRLLLHSVGYSIQAKRYGGLKPALKRRLKHIAEGYSDKTPVAAPKLKAGTRLIREWHGVTHTVDVIEGGFLWKGERHRSLSAIARKITGAHWSGPRFFGLTSAQALG